MVKIFVCSEIKKTGLRKLKILLLCSIYIVRSWVAVIHLVRQYVCAKTKLGRGWRDEQRRGLKAKTTGGYILGQILKFYPI